MASVIQANKLDELIQNAVAKYHPAELVSSSGREENLDQGRIRFSQTIPWPEVYAYGEFNICRDWMDIDTQVLRLQREIKLKGDVYVFVGEYVGPAVHMTAALQRTRNMVPPACTRDLMSLHRREKYHTEMASEMCASMEMKDIYARCTELGVILSADQTSLFQTLLRKHIQGDAAFIPVGAAPGASKTFTGAIYASTFSLYLEPGEAIVWLTPSRKQRLRALNVLRKSLPDGILAGSLGRASEMEAAMEKDKVNGSSMRRPLAW